MRYATCRRQRRRHGADRRRGSIALVIVVILFGGSKIPELMKGIGSGMREFKKGLNEDEEDKSKAAKTDTGKKDA